MEEKYIGFGVGNSKKIGEQRSAKMALIIFGLLNDDQYNQSDIYYPDWSLIKEKLKNDQDEDEVEDRILNTQKEFFVKDDDIIDDKSNDSSSNDDLSEDESDGNKSNNSSSNEDLSEDELDGDELDV